jgi:DNA-binding PadR family transcriptional regulator
MHVRRSSPHYGAQIATRRPPSPTEQAVAEAAPLADARAAAGAAAPAGGAGSSDPLVSGLRRAGLLKLLVLRLCAADEPAYGNQLMERISELTGGLLAVNPNTMYPLLRSLEGDGLIAGEWEHPERRSRRFYRLTAAGETERARLGEEIAPRLDAAAAAIDAIRAALAREGAG